MLLLSEFRHLPSAEKARYIIACGQYLHYRVKGWCKIDLYLVKNGPEPGNAFYAELWHYYDLKAVGLVRILDQTPPFDPYIENIRLKGI